MRAAYPDSPKASLGTQTVAVLVLVGSTTSSPRDVSKIDLSGPHLWIARWMRTQSAALKVGMLIELARLEAETENLDV